MIVYCSWRALHDDRCFPTCLALGSPLESLLLTRRERIGPSGRPCTRTMNIHSLTRYETPNEALARIRGASEMKHLQGEMHLPHEKFQKVRPIKASRLKLARRRLRRVAAV